MKLTDYFQNKKKPTISFELFPARSEKQEATLAETIKVLSDLKPDFVSVTFGAGGSTRQGSRQLIEKLKNECSLEVVAYFACYGLGPGALNSVLKDYHDLGIENLLAVRGDPPQDKEFKPHPDSLNHASELLSFIKPHYPFCLGAAGYPEGHIDAESMDKDLEYLKLKVESGADYIITNYFYDNTYYYDYVKRVRDAGITVPVLPGIMPVYSIKMMDMLASLCGAAITDTLRQGLAALPDGDKDALLKFGIEFAYAQCADLIKSGVPGLHMYTMDRWQSAKAIGERLRNDGLI